MSFETQIYTSNPNGDFNKSVLLVGDIEENNMMQFAEMLFNEADKLNQDLTVNIAKMLPLKDTIKDWMTSSLIAIFTDLGNVESLNSCKASLKYAPKEYFLNKVLFVGINFNSGNSWCVEPEELSNLASELMCPVLWADLNHQTSSETLAKQILKKLKLLTCDDINVCSLLHTGVLSLQSS